MDDLARIKSNVAKMAAQNAPMEDIDGYIASEGVSIDDVRNFKGQAASQPERREHSNFEKLITGEPINQWSPQADADLAERVAGTSGFSDATGSGIAKAIPFADEIASGLNAPFRAARDWYQGDGFDISRAYDRNMQTEAELQRRRDERSPIASTAGSVAGAIGAAGPLVKGGFSLLQGAKPTLASLMGRGAAEGAAYGAAYGAGEGRGLRDRAINAGLGAAAGGTVGGLTGSLARIGANRVNADSIPSAEALRDMGKAAYQRADDAGVVFAKDAMESLRSGVRADFAEFGFLPKLQPGAAEVLREIDRVSKGNVTLKGLETIRKMAGNAYIPGNKSNNALVAKVVDRIDEMASSPAMIGDSQAASAALKEARDMWSRLSKSERVTDAITRGELRAASTGSGGNADNAVRQNLRRLLEKPRGFTETEKKALEAAVKGTAGQNALRLAGKLSPQGNGLMAALGIGGTMVNPLVGLASLGGMGAKTAADAMTRQNAGLLQLLIRNGGELPEAAMSPLLKAIADATTRSAAQQLPKYTGQ